MNATPLQRLQARRPALVPLLTAVPELRPLFAALASVRELSPMLDELLTPARILRVLEECAR